MAYIKHIVFFRCKTPTFDGFINAIPVSQQIAKTPTNNAEKSPLSSPQQKSFNFQSIDSIGMFGTSTPKNCKEMIDKSCNKLDRAVQKLTDRLEMKCNDLNNKESLNEFQKNTITPVKTIIKSPLSTTTNNDIEQRKARRKRSETEKKIEIKSDINDNKFQSFKTTTTNHISPMVINPILYLQMIKNLVNNYSINNNNSNELKFGNNKEFQNIVAKERYYFSTKISIKFYYIIFF